MSEHAPYASDPAASRGRVHAVDGAASRSEFQRDRDRIIHSTAFRRLQYKTQVFLHHEGLHFRTRLTHTLEVSQMARSIARALGLNEDLAEAVALAHDLGHTPFGHAGERVLNAKMAELGGFDHNIQALRVVSLLENRYAAHDGLNLTWEMLEGILKHNGPLTDAAGLPVGKYADEGLPDGLDAIPMVAPWQLDTRASLEAQSAAVADDIAYNAHDIDDAVRAGLLDLDDLRDVPLAGPLLAEIDARWPGLERPRRTHELQRRLITGSIVDVIETSRALLADAAPDSADDARTSGHSLIAFSPAMAASVEGLKSFLFANVYRHSAVMTPVKAGEEVVAELFDAYMNSSPMPGRWGVAAETVESRQRARIVCDFIAGMTDPYAMAEHSRLFDV
jgi:dGTPase